MLEVHVLELNKGLTGQPVDEWIRFFNSRTEEDLEMIKTKSAGIQEAMRILLFICSLCILCGNFTLHSFRTQARNHQLSYKLSLMEKRIR